MIKHVPRLFSFLHGLTGEHPQKTNIPLRSVMLETIESLHVHLSFSPFFHRKINISRQGVQVTEGKRKRVLIKSDRDNARSCCVEKYDDTLS